MRRHGLFSLLVSVSLSLSLYLLAGCGRSDESGMASGSGLLEIVTTDSGVEMVVIPGGWFEMGLGDDREGDAPLHRVWVDSFIIDRLEVSQELYRVLEVSDPSRFEGEGLPVEQQSWLDAVRFCNLRSWLEGFELCYDEETWECDFTANGYRLPTEAEWEYAARAGGADDYSFGNDPRELSRYAWFDDNAGEQTHQVGTRRSSRWGLYDMYGNVAEWCNDYYDEGYFLNSPERNPRGPDLGDLRIVRGGAWDSSEEDCRSGYRVGSASVDDGCLVSDAIGFRCVRGVPFKR
ncbi:formylglycine-generating enzyme family protein [Gemmatimonadota bacterium]